MNIEESIAKVKEYINYMPLGARVISFRKGQFIDCQIAVRTLLTAYEKEKRLAEANLKNSEEFQDNMCNHRCILNSKVEELKAELEKEKGENKRLRKCHLQYEEMTGIDLLLPSEEE